MNETPELLVKRLESRCTHTVWGYVRVSSESQEDNQSLDMQKADIIKYCNEHQLSEPLFVEEVASAAKPVLVVSIPGAPKEDKIGTSSPRPLFLLLLTHLRKVRETVGRQVPVHLIVWKLDRLSRVDYEQELFFNMLSRDGVRLHSVMPTEDHMLDGGHVKDPARAFTRTVMAAVAQYERAMIELRMGSGMAHKAAKGEFTGGIPPFGYETKNKDLVIVPHEAAMVRYIFFLRYNYKLSESALSRWVMQNKHKDDTIYYDRHKIHRILTNKQLYQGVYQDRFGALHSRPDLRILPDDLSQLERGIYDQATQPQRTESERLSRSHHDAVDERAGIDHRDSGHGSPGGSEGSSESGLHSNSENNLSQAGVGESDARGSVA